MQRIHLQPRIVAEGRYPQRLGHRAGLEGCVLLVGGPVLGRESDLGMVAEGFDARRETGEQRLQLFRFPLVSRREDDQVQWAGSCFSPRIRFCAWISFRIPDFPSVIMEAISRSLKASPSAVPWISTIRPDPVSTRFMSTWAFESSA